MRDDLPRSRMRSGEEIRRQKFSDQDEYRDAKQWIGDWQEKDRQVKDYEKNVLQCRTQIETLKTQTGGRRREGLKPTGRGSRKSCRNLKRSGKRS